LGLAPDSEIWTINDWYMRKPQSLIERPDRVYNLHLLPETRSNRFVGDWKKIYSESGADIVTLGPMDGLDSRLLDTESLDSQFDKELLTCSISIMICEAMLEGFEEISLCGVELLAGEFVYQVRGILAAIEAARGRGIKVTAKNESKWKATLCKIDWKTISDIQRYWIREAAIVVRINVSPENLNANTNQQRGQ